jgi:hypothetical protein
LETVGSSSFWIVTSSVEEAHTPLEMVQRRVTLLPAPTPVTVVVGDAGVVIDADPETMLHAPVPTAGALAAIVKEDVLHTV